MNLLFIIQLIRLLLLGVFSYFVLPKMYCEINKNNDDLNRLRLYLFVFGVSYALTLGISVAIIYCMIASECVYLGMSDLLVINTLNMAISTIMMVLIYKKYY